MPVSTDPFEYWTGTNAQIPIVVKSSSLTSLVGATITTRLQAIRPEEEKTEDYTFTDEFHDVDSVNEMKFFIKPTTGQTTTIKPGLYRVLPKIEKDDFVFVVKKVKNILILEGF